MEPKKLKSGRYELVAQLGAGSQAETYEAIDHGSSKDRPLADQWKTYVTQGGKSVAQAKARVAIKCFRLRHAASWKDVELAEREARTLASLSHPGVPVYIEHFEEDGALYLVMEKIEGESLAAIKARKGKMSEAEVTRMLTDIAAALRYLHALAPPVVHRDIKPGNVIRRPDGSFTLVDFGAVRDRLKPAGGSTVVGTFGFMAPEQFMGRASTKSDVYGAAATAMAMLTGEEPEDLPHEGLSIDVAEALPARTPRSLVRALASMLEPDPDRRAASIESALSAASTRGAASEREPRRKTSKAERKAGRRAERERRRAERVVIRTRRAPWPIRLFGHIGLFVAFVLVTLVVGVVLPLVLTLFSYLFGEPLRRARTASVRAAGRAERSLQQAGRRLSGEALAAEPDEPDEPAVRVRVEPRERDPLDHDEEVVRKDRMQRHARPPATRKYWGR